MYNVIVSQINTSILWHIFYSLTLNKIRVITFLKMNKIKNFCVENIANYRLQKKIRELEDSVLMQDGEVETTQNEVLKEQEPTKKGSECEAICKTYQAVRYTCN